MNVAGTTVYRISWVPGEDRLLAACHCGASNELEDPVAAWDWLLDHPHGQAPTPGHTTPSLALNR